MASSALISDSEAWKNLKAHLRDLMSDAARCKSMMVWSSLSILLPSLNAYNIGQLLAIYEHRIAVEGFVWGINSFD